MTPDDLRRRRLTLKLSQEQLGHTLNVTRQSIYMWEAGKTAIPALLEPALRYVELMRGLNLVATSLTQADVDVTPPL